MTSGAAARCRVAVAVLVLASAAAAKAAEPPRFERVLFLPTAGRVSVVLEMSGAPASVTSRRISADLLEIDAAPVAIDRPSAFTAPAGSTLVSTVVIDGSTSSEGPVTLRARITLRETSEGTVRVQGTRVYVDIASAGSPVAAPRRQAAVGAAPSRRARTPQAATETAVAPDAAAEAAVQSALSRFGELLPFLTSAADAPAAPVLAALGAPVSELQKSVGAIQAPPGRRPAVSLLSSAIAAAATAIDPAFRGDRDEQVRQAAIFFQQAKAER